MRCKRERLFDCSCGNPGHELHLSIRAWTPAEAASAMEDALTAAGVPRSGEITVRDARHRVVLRVMPPRFPEAGVSGAA